MNDVLNDLTEFSEANNSMVLNLFVNAIDIEFSSPIIYALKNKRQQVIKTLLKVPKLCVKQASVKYGTPMHLALQNRDVGTIKKLLKFPQDFDKFDEEGNTLMHIVMKHFNEDTSLFKGMAHMLISQGVQICQRNKIFNTPLHQAL